MTELKQGHQVTVRHGPRPSTGKWVTDRAIVATEGTITLELGSVPPEPPPAPTGPIWGAMGGWGGAVGMPMTPDDFRDMYARGVRAVMVSASWRVLEPQDGVFSAEQFSKVQAEINLMQSYGFGIILNYQLHDPPAWLLNKPNSRFVDQNGEVYVGSPEVDFMSNVSLLPYAQRYTSELIKRLGTDWVIVRVGGGHWGELQYPPARPNHYWCFNALAQRPDPAWRPGQASPNGEAARFLNYYLDRLSAWQNWQIASLRTAGYSGRVGVLYASDGMRPEGTGAGSAFAQAVATNLNGSSAPERNAEIQHGFDHARHIRAISDRATSAWCTYAESTGNDPDTQTWIARLGRSVGLPGHWAENAGNGDTTDQHENAVRQFRREQGEGYVWVRGDNLYGTEMEILTYQRLMNEPL